MTTPESTNLLTYVAEAIRSDQESGGAGILRPDEVEALQWAVRAAVNEPGHRDALLLVLADLGPIRMHITCNKERRVDAYWRHCAKVAIEAYDRWFHRMVSARRGPQGAQP